MNKKAVVLGGHVQGLGIVRALGKIGYSVTVLDESKYNIARHSRYCDSFHTVNNQEIVQYLLSQQGLEKHENSLIFPTNDEHVEELSKNLDDINSCYNPATDSWDVIKFCFNKRKTYRAAKKGKVTIPETYFPETLEEVREIAPDLSYPTIIKPAVMYRFYKKFKQKVFVCNDKEELISNYEKAIMIIPENEVIIQDIIPGSSKHQYSVGCLFDRDKPLVTIAARRRRQHPIDFGNATTYAETVNEPRVVERAYKILKTIGYKGICEVEFKKDPRDGEFKFLEINPRTWKWHSIAEQAETPFIESYVKLLEGQEPTIKNKWQDAAWSHYITDVPTILKMMIKGLYSRPEKNPLKQAVLELGDFEPALYEILYLPYLIKTR